MKNLPASATCAPASSVLQGRLLPGKPCRSPFFSVCFNEKNQIDHTLMNHERACSHFLEHISRTHRPREHACPWWVDIIIGKAVPICVLLDRVLLKPGILGRKPQNTRTGITRFSLLSLKVTRIVVSIPRRGTHLQEESRPRRPPLQPRLAPLAPPGAQATPL